MKITKMSQKLISFFKKNQYIDYIEPSKRTEIILTNLYNDIVEAYKYILSLKQVDKQIYYMQIKKIQTASQITKPNNFNFNSFPESIRNHINETASTEITYTFSLFERNMRLIFTVEETNVELNIEVYNKYVESIMLWLYILQQYASKQCSNTLIVYFYFTSLEKQLPDSNIHILDETNVNTAFTTSCPKDSEIVVYRKEEWFKVFIHETFHSFGLDFSNMNSSICTNRILQLFPVKSEVNLYESYTEFWAEIMNASFCSFFLLKNKNNVSEFLSTVETTIHFERVHSFFQLVKTLNFMGLTYNDLYSKKKQSLILRETLYKEKTSVLSYYIVKTILLNNYSGFLNWCKRNNFSLLQFKQTPQNLQDFCEFIEKNYKHPDMLNGIHKTEIFLHSFYKKDMKKQEFIFNTMRMSICEMG
jgi:hypothetical protein